MLDQARTHQIQVCAYVSPPGKMFAQIRWKLTLRNQIPFAPLQYTNGPCAWVHFGDILQFALEFVVLREATGSQKCVFAKLAKCGPALIYWTCAASPRLILSSADWPAAVALQLTSLANGPCAKEGIAIEYLVECSLRLNLPWPLQNGNRVTNPNVELWCHNGRHEWQALHLTCHSCRSALSISLDASVL